MASVLEHGDFRVFLAAWFREEKTRDASLSLRKLAARVGYNSPGFFSQVLQGSSSLSLEMAERFATALELRKHEREYFLELVRLDLSRTPAERKTRKTRLGELRTPPGRALSKLHQEFLSQWHHAAIRELLALRPTTDDGSSLGKLLNPAIAPELARESVRLLLRLGLAHRTAQGIVRSDEVLTVAPEVPLESTAPFFQQTLELAARSLESTPREQRNLSWVTISVSANAEREIIEELRAFRRRVLDIARRDPAPDRVLHLNMQLFPLTHTNKASA